VTVHPNPAFTVRGDPFGAGAHLDFPANMPAGDFELFQLEMRASTAVPPFGVEIVGHTRPSDPSHVCPTVVLSDGTPACATDLTAHPSRPTSQTPPDRAERVSATRPLVLDVRGTGDTCPCVGPGEGLVYFGTTPDPPLMWHGEALQLPLQVGVPAPSTTYYWRYGYNLCGTWIGPVWSFTTEPPTAVQKQSWGQVKRLYR
jgi:hypothetical protein